MGNMKRIPNPEKQLAYLAYINRENEFSHHGYDEEMKQYLMMQRGDPEAVEESRRMLERNAATALSADPVRNLQYLFVANVTLAVRFAIEGGLDAETAYNAGDMYVRKLDLCRSGEEVTDLHREMFSFFTARMASRKTEKAVSRSIAAAVEYIESNLHTALRIGEVAAHVNLSTGYFSVLFHRETGSAFSDYVMNRKIETARNMLRYSDYSSTEISEILAFSSQSYFIRCFRKAVGMTPSEYRRRHYAGGTRSAGEAAEGRDWRAGTL